MSEQQRAAIVTGAAGGIGRELVVGLLGKGLRVAAVDRGAKVSLSRGAPWVITAEDLAAHREQKAPRHSLTSHPAQQSFQFQ